MYDKAIPIFEVKNRLSYFLHKAKEEGSVFISNRGKPEFVLQTIEEYEQQIQAKPKEKSLIERIHESRKTFSLENDDFDFTSYYDNIKEKIPMTRDSEEHLFDEV